MKDVSLVILAAGIGSRFGGGVKQLQPVGPNGELIIDYSVHDAVKAGFNRIVFILRRDIFDDFREVIGKRTEEVFSSLGVSFEYVFQDKNDLPDGFTLPKGREKPWGTGQAVLCCRGVIDGPFAVINADDYYGSAAFEKAYGFLTGKHEEKYGLVGYVLKNTLSDNGAVTRGICSTDGCRLTGIKETRGIVKAGEGAESESGPVDMDATVSMNFWMFPREYMEKLEEGFPEFLRSMKDPMKDEYLLPVIVDSMLRKGECDVRVEQSDDCWFGVTYKEDKPAVVRAFEELYEQGKYSLDLYGDVKKAAETKD